MELQIHLDQFDGPLDLLLQMIRKAKIRIEDIFVTNIIDQYLEWMPLVDGKMEHASEFLETAALLLEIKSQRLLPKEPTAEDESELTPEQLLVRRLEEYARIKEASEMMREIEEEFYLNTFYKLPEEYFSKPQTVEFTDLSLTVLCEAFKKVCVREKPAAARQAQELKREVYQIPERIAYILKKLSARPYVLFSSLFGNTSSRMEKVVTFIALLELIRQNRVRIEQAQAFEQIRISRCREVAV